MDRDGCGVIMIFFVVSLFIFTIGKFYERGVEHGIEEGICIVKGGTYEWPHCVRKDGFIKVKQP